MSVVRNRDHDAIQTTSVHMLTGSYRDPYGKQLLDVTDKLDGPLLDQLLDALEFGLNVGDNELQEVQLVIRSSVRAAYPALGERALKEAV